MSGGVILFVHGFWSSGETWDRLIEQLKKDVRLTSAAEMKTFTYASPKLRRPLSPARIPDFNDIAQTLAEHYRLELEDFDEVAIVAHSQGGLITQRFLEWMVIQRRARELNRIKLVVLLACPNEGSEYLQLLRRAVGLRRNPQARELEVLRDRVADTRRHILTRIVHATVEDDHQCRISFRVYAGAEDKVVTRASAQSAFEDATSIPGDHRSILDPAAPGSLTAKTLATDVLAHLGRELPPRAAVEAGSQRDEWPAASTASASSPARIPVRVAARPPAAVPDQLRDRIDDLQRLRKALYARQDRVVSLVGRPGTGKTALVSRLFRDAEREHDSPFAALDYLSARGHMSVTGAILLERIVRLMPESDAKERFRDDLAKRRASWIDRAEDVIEAISDDILLVIDQAEDLFEEQGRCVDRGLDAFIRGLAARNDHRVTLLLVSATEPDDRILGRSRSSRLDLDRGLPDDCAADLLRDLTREPNLALSPRFAPELLLTVAKGHPRTLEVALAACHLDPSLSPQNLVTVTVLPHQERLPRLTDAILAALDTKGLVVVAALAVLGLPVPVRAVQRVVDGLVDREAVTRELGRLSAARFVRVDARNFYLPRDPESIQVRAMLASGGLGEVEERLLERAADYFGGEKRQNNVERIEDLAAHFREISLRLQLGEEVTSLELMEDLENDYLNDWGYSYVLLPWRRLLRERFRGEQYGRSNLSSMANAYRDIEEYGEALACLEEALSDCESQAELAGVPAPERPIFLTQMASTAWADFRFTLSAELYLQVLKEPQGVDDVQRGEAHLGLCHCYSEVGNFDRAWSHQRNALAFATKSTNARLLEAQAVLAGGIIERNLGNYDSALRMLEEATLIAGSHGYRRVQVRALDAMAGALLESEDPDQARERAETAVRVAAESGVVDVARGANSTLALVHLSEGRFDDARRTAIAAARFFRSPRALSAQIALGIAAYRSERETSEAVSAFLAALETCQELTRREPQAYVVLDSMGLALTGLSLLGARDAFKEAEAAYTDARSKTMAPGAVRRAQLYLEALTAEVNPRLIAGIEMAARGAGKQGV
jgi:tetratricopeptide (TPR) repeat protein/pimeloyl-ACP methyl ester carboxylesterase